MHADHSGGVDRDKFSALVRRRWSISLTLTIITLVIYYGFILVLAFRPDLLAAKLGTHMTLGIPVGLGVIVSACVLTGIYVRWANQHYDEAVKDIMHTMRGKE